MRRTTTTLATVALAILLTAGMALAATLEGTSGNDVLRGGRGPDVIKGYGGSDTISGGYGRDRLYGSRGNDRLSGGHFPDRISGGKGRDTVDAGQGNDYVDVADGRLDSVSCGVGADDTAVVDDADLANRSFEDFVRLSSCENVVVR